MTSSNLLVWLDEPSPTTLVHIVRELQERGARLRLTTKYDAALFLSLEGWRRPVDGQSAVELELPDRDAEQVAAELLEVMEVMATDARAYPSLEFLKSEKLLFCLDRGEWDCFIDRTVASSLNRVLPVPVRTADVDVYDELDDCRLFLGDVAASFDQDELVDVVNRSFDALTGATASTGAAAQLCQAVAILDPRGRVVGDVVISRMGCWATALTSHEGLVARASGALSTWSPASLAGLDERVVARTLQIHREARELLSH